MEKSKWINLNIINIIFYLKNDKKNLVYPTNNARNNRGLHSPAEINLLGSLGDMIISFSIQINSESLQWDRSKAVY